MDRCRHRHCLGRGRSGQRDYPSQCSFRWAHASWGKTKSRISTPPRTGWRDDRASHRIGARHAKRIIVGNMWGRLGISASRRSGRRPGGRIPHQSAVRPSHFVLLLSDLGLLLGAKRPKHARGGGRRRFAAIAQVVGIPLGERQAKGDLLYLGFGEAGQAFRCPSRRAAQPHCSDTRRSSFRNFSSGT
jgi:hypothetical protein